MIHPPLRETLNQTARQISDNAQSIWDWLAEKLDLAQACPQAASGIVVSQLVNREGTYYILKNPAHNTYFRLSAKDYFLWQRIDGNHTVKELVVAYFMEYKVLAFGRVSSLLEGLKNQFFLVEQPVNVYQQVRTQLDHRNPQARLAQLGRMFIEKQFVIKGLDKRLTRLYEKGGWMFYTRVAQILWLVVSLVGLICFSQVMFDSQYEVVAIGGNALLGILSLSIVYFVSIFIHELFHALTVKHYRREVLRGGFMIYFGMPAFFVDTSDIWMESKRARLAVTWAGPYADLILAGLASLILFLWPRFALNPVLFQFALVTYVSVLFNMNPLLELDGYFLLMDGLEIPMLRRKSLEFIRSGVWVRLKTLWAGEKPVWKWAGEFSREERIFVIFGLLAAIWTGYSIVQALSFWQSHMTSAVTSLFLQSSTTARMVILVIAGVLGLALAAGFGWIVIGLVRRILVQASQAGFFSTPRRKAAWAWALVITAGSVSLVYPPLSPLIILETLILAIYFAACNARDYRGSRFAKVFWLVSVTSLLIWIAEVGKLVTGRLSVWPDSLEGMATWAVGLSALLALGVFFPTLVAFWHTRTGPAVATIGLGLLFLSGSALFGFLSVWAYLFLAAGLGLQQAAYRQRVILAQMEPSPAQSDLDLLKQAIQWTIAGLNALLVEIVGNHQAHILEEKFNHYAQMAAWHIRLKHNLVIDASPATWGLHQLGNTYAVALNLLLDLIAGQMGEKMTIRALQCVYDAMPWEMREIASLHLFSEVKRAQAVSRQFQSTQQTYRSLLRRIPLFAVLSPDEIDRLCERFQTEKFAPGQVIIRQGERGDKFYIVTRGSVQVEQVQQSVSEIVNRHERGGYFGQVALLNDAPRNATCRAVTPTEVVSLNRNDFNQLVKACFDLREKLESSISRATLLRQIPLFADMDDASLHLIGAQMYEENYETGAVIIRQGDMGETFYVIESGRVQVLAATEHGERVVNERGPGEYLGEIALLLQTPRTATVRAMIPTRLLTLNKSDFDRLVVPQLYANRVLEQETSRRMLQLQRAVKAGPGS